MWSKHGILAALNAMLVALCVLPAHAEQARVLQATDLNAEPFSDAKVTGRIGKDKYVDVLQKQGGWWQVQSDGKQGWVRNSRLRTEATAAAAPQTGLLALESGRAGHGDLIATTGIRGIPKPTSSSNHALIMTIGAYRDGIPQLKGVKYDAETAQQIARKMGVPDENIRTYRDGELTLEGMEKVFSELEARVQQDDQVFIYYSGHGSRQLLKEEGQEERCAESLLSIDGYGFFDAELESRLKRLAEKAQKLIVLIDACHSGGVTTRSAAGKRAAPESEFTGKFWQPKDGREACTKPINVLTRSINSNSRAAGSGAGNYTYIAAALDNEISLDQSGKGGVASQAWLECLNGRTVDADGSGGLSAEEIRVCAQEKINQKLANAPGVLPHHVSITGNSRVVLGFASKEPPQKIAAAAVDAPPAPVKKPAPATAATLSAPVAVATSTAVAPAAAVNTPNPIATLGDILGNRDDRRRVEFKTAKQKLRIGKDSLEFSLTSSHEGYVYLLMVGTDGTSFDLLFPNQLDRNNVIQAGETLNLPRPKWELVAQGPQGKDTLLAIVAESPRDFSKIGMRPVGPFSVIDVKSAASTTQDIQLTVGSSSNSADSQCASGSMRTLSVQKRCSNAYGAALLVVEEIN